MDFGALPPEVNSGRLYLGPGTATLLAASAGWEGLAAELHTAAGGYQAVIVGLIDESWIGSSSMSMAAAVAPYLLWMRLSATRCEEAAGRATAAASAFDTAYALTVPPPVVTANRCRLLTLVATNILGQNTPAIMATEAEYGEMWAQDATAMYGYAAHSAFASNFTTFTSPPRTTGAGGAADQADAVAQPVTAPAGGTAQSAAARLISSVPQALHGLSNPGSSPGVGTVAALASSRTAPPSSPALSMPDMSGLGSMGLADSFSGFDDGAVAGLGQADPLGTLSVPPSWADALSVIEPEPVLDANVMPGGWGAMPSPTAGRHVSKLPSGGMAGRGSAGAFQRLGLRTSIIPGSPITG
jgi:PPE-repeat protein